MCYPSAVLPSRPPLTPNLYVYSEYRLYVRDWLMLARGQPGGRSLRSMMRALGIDMSTMQRLLLQAVHLPPDAVERLPAALWAEGDEAAYLLDLVKLSNPSSAEEHAEAQDRVLAARRARGVAAIDGEVGRLIASPVLSAVHELVGCPGFREDPRWIAATLRPPVTTEVAADALVQLVEIGVVGRGTDGRLAQTSPVVQSAQFPVEVAAFQGVDAAFERAADDVARGEAVLSRQMALRLDADGLERLLARTAALRGEIAQILAAGQANPSGESARVLSVLAFVAPATSIGGPP